MIHGSGGYRAIHRGGSEDQVTNEGGGAGNVVIDPRAAVVPRRLRDVDRKLAFISSKGGVGKSSCAVLSALLLARRGCRVGLLDLDFHGATGHLFLGLDPDFPEEEGGILPLRAVTGLGFMSITLFTGERGVPFRGEEISSSILELLAVTIWGELDYLVVDMPPGMGDELFDLFALIPDCEPVVVTTPSPLSGRVVARLVRLLQEGGRNILGVLVNQVSPAGLAPSGNRPGAQDKGLFNLKDVPVAGIGYDPGLDEAVGDPEKLLSTRFAAQLGEALESFLEPGA
ncbi:MAG: P-loop NTPase [Spirochaetota bacterium]